jgi:P pilus assembly chaperone PapD
MRNIWSRWWSLRLLLVALATWPCASVAQSPTPAPAGGLLVSPTYVLFDGRERSKTFTLTNRGDTVETYRISIIDRRQMPDGQLAETDRPGPGEGFASRLVRYAPREVLLQPNKPQTVRVLLQLPGDQPDGEYRSHILFQQVPKPSEPPIGEKAEGLSVTIKAIFGISVPIIIRKGQLEASASLSELHALRLADGRAAVGLRLNRSGTRSLRGDLNVLVDGAPAAQLNNINVFLSTPYREVTIPLTTPSDLKGHRLSVEFNEGENVTSPASAKETLIP